MFDLTGKRALITGASRGVGTGIAKAFAAAGAEVVLTGRNEDRLAKLAADIAAAGGKVTFVAGELASREAVRAIARQAGEIDILVNNAAHLLGKRSSLLVLSDEEWDMDFAVNVTAPVMLIQALVPAMVQRGGGAVINISSIAAKMPNATHLGYAASKAALEAVTKGLAVDPETKGVRFNAVALGITATEAWDDMPLEGITLAEVGKMMTPIGRATDVSEVAAVCLLLASDAATALTGTVITLDGGMTAGSFIAGGASRRVSSEQ